MMSPSITWEVYITFPSPMIFMMSLSIKCAFYITCPGWQVKSSIRISEDISMEVQQDR